MQYVMASISCGKDSLEMVESHIEQGRKLDEVVMYDTRMEFRAIYDTWDRLTEKLDLYGIKHTVLRPETPFVFDMINRLVTNRDGSGTHYGYRWCGGRCRWGTTAKNKALDAYAESKDAIVLVGIAADETHRLNDDIKPYKRHPLIEAGKTEADCLAACYARGYEWRETGADTPDGTIRLYDILDRVSCWCCANKNLKELRNIWLYLPEYWERLKGIQAQLDRPMKSYGSVFDLEQRFCFERERKSEGKSITNREFFRELRLYVGKGECENVSRFDKKINVDSCER